MQTPFPPACYTPESFHKTWYNPLVQKKLWFMDLHSPTLDLEAQIWQYHHPLCSFFFHIEFPWCWYVSIPYENEKEGLCTMQNTLFAYAQWIRKIQFDVARDMNLKWILKLLVHKKGFPFKLQQRIWKVSWRVWKQGHLKMCNVVNNVPCNTCTTRLDGRFANLKRKKVVCGGFITCRRKKLNDKNKPSIVPIIPHRTLILNCTSLGCCETTCTT